MLSKISHILADNRSLSLSYLWFGPYPISHIPANFDFRSHFDPINIHFTSFKWISITFKVWIGTPKSEFEPCSLKNPPIWKWTYESEFEPPESEIEPDPCEPKTCPNPKPGDSEESDTKPEPAVLHLNLTHYPQQEVPIMSS